MTSHNRRIFLLQVAAGSAVLAASRAAQAQGAPMLNETDAQAVALGYAADTSKVDQKKFPKHAASQACSGCQLYTGKPGEASGPCGIFPGKHVSAKGWCSAWVKKA
ncbi:MAG: high-potential iron-sulfur protein [Hydrogenophaga sp.]